MILLAFVALASAACGDLVCRSCLTDSSCQWCADPMLGIGGKCTDAGAVCAADLVTDELSCPDVEDRDALAVIDVLRVWGVCFASFLLPL